jgi:molybdate transport system substrate-binding protein
VTRFLLALVLAACRARAADLVVAATADLSPVTPDLDKGFSRVAHVPLTFTFAASGALVQQIQGAGPVDVFLSADETYVRELVRSGRLEAEVAIYALGRLGLWSKRGNVKSIEDLKKPEIKHIAMANPAHVPYGIAAKKALEGRGLWTQLGPKIVFGENVRQAMQLAQTGNADAVITAWTLLINRSILEPAGPGILLPAEWHDPIRQSGGVVKSSNQAAVARQFLRFLTSLDGRKILQKGGLFPP